MRRIVKRTLLGWPEQRALGAGATELTARAGAVIFGQRLGSAVNLSLHLHALVLRGAFAARDVFVSTMGVVYGIGCETLGEPAARMRG